MNHERRSMNGVRRPGGDCSPRPARGGTRQPGEQDPGALLGVSWASASSWSHRGDWGVRLLWPKQSDRESIAASGMPPSDVSTDPPRLANDRVYPRAGSEDRRDRVRPSEVFALEHGDVGRPLRSCADCRPRRRAWSTRCAWSIFVRSRSHLAGKRGRGQPVRSGRSWNWVVACRLINLNPW
jgi:hypothetical protein